MDGVMSIWHLPRPLGWAARASMIDVPLTDLLNIKGPIPLLSPVEPSLPHRLTASRPTDGASVPSCSPAWSPGVSELWMKYCHVRPSITPQRRGEGSRIRNKKMYLILYLNFCFYA